MIGLLPSTLTVNGTEYKIRTDFRDVLNIVVAFNDPELDVKEKMFVCLYVLYEDFESIPDSDYEEAYKQAVWFIDCGEEPKEGDRHPKCMDWEQDEKILFPAINSVAGCETRSAEYIHWWTFMGYFMEIHEGVFSQVLSLRQKKTKGKKLEKWEQEFWRANKDMCELHEKISEEEQKKRREERDRINKLLNS